MLTVEDGLDRLKGGVPIGFGILLAGLGEEAPVPKAFGFVQLETVLIPHRKDDNHGTRYDKQGQSRDGL